MLPLSRRGGCLLTFEDIWTTYISDTFVQEVVSQGYELKLFPLPDFSSPNLPVSAHRSADLHWPWIFQTKVSFPQFIWQNSFKDFTPTCLSFPNPKGASAPYWTSKIWLFFLTSRVLTYVNIFSEHQHFLHFYCGALHYKFLTMPFGFSSTSCVFTKLLAPALAPLLSHSIPIVGYLDDLLLRKPLMWTLRQRGFNCLNITAVLVDLEASEISVSTNSSFGITGSRTGQISIQNIYSTEEISDSLVSDFSSPIQGSSNSLFLHESWWLLPSRRCHLYTFIPDLYNAKFCHFGISHSSPCTDWFIWHWGSGCSWPGSSGIWLWNQKSPSFPSSQRSPQNTPACWAVKESWALCQCSGLVHCQSLVFQKTSWNDGQFVCQCSLGTIVLEGHLMWIQSDYTAALAYISSLRGTRSPTAAA